MSAKQMMPKAALWAGLDKVSPETAEQWLAGVAAYDESQNRGETLGDSYIAALNAVASDATSWMAGKNEIYRILFSQNSVEAAKAVASKLFTPRPRPSQRTSAQHS